MINEKVGKKQLDHLVRGCSFVVDTFDRNDSRLDVNEVCVNQGIAASHGFVQDMSEEIITVLPGKTPCLHCVLDENFPELKETPVLGFAAGMVGIQMAAATIKYLTGFGILKTGCRLIWDMTMDHFYDVPLTQQLKCPVCSFLNS